MVTGETWNKKKSYIFQAYYVCLSRVHIHKRLFISLFVYFFAPRRSINLKKFKSRSLKLIRLLLVLSIFPFLLVVGWCSWLFGAFVSLLPTHWRFFVFFFFSVESYTISLKKNKKYTEKYKTTWLCFRFSSCSDFSFLSFFSLSYLFLFFIHVINCSWYFFLITTILHFLFSFFSVCNFYSMDFICKWCHFYCVRCHFNFLSIGGRERSRSAFIQSCCFSIRKWRVGFDSKIILKRCKSFFWIASSSWRI